MNTKTKLINVALITLLVSFVAMNMNMAARSDGAEETISGTVVAVDWDEDDEVTSVAISVMTMIEDPENEEEPEEIYEDYLIGETDKGRELWKHIGKEVEATGIVTTNDDGTKTISVKSYRLIDSET